MLYQLLFSLMITLNVADQPVTQPKQPLEGPGSKIYLHQEVVIHDLASTPDGYWIYEPASPTPISANVIVFTHGYGAMNPMIYGKWIKHMVKKGNIVIFPRYQRNLISPSPSYFTPNVATAIKNALEELKTGNHVRPITDHLTLVGHSYGGAISADLAVHYEEYEIPKPKAVMLCSPGTGPFKASHLDSYEKMPADINLLVLVSNDDYVVGDVLGAHIFATATNTPNRNFIRQYADHHGIPAITAGHNQSYSLDVELDSGNRNFTSRRAAKISKIDAMDYYGYWKLLDALTAFTRTGMNKRFAFGNTPEQRNLGEWSDGKKVRELEVHVP